MAALTTLLLTGAAGFVGHHVLEHALATTDWDVVCVGSFRKGGKYDRIAEVLDGKPEWERRVRIVPHNLTAPFTAQTRARIGDVDYVLAAASLSHVDDSLEDPVPFVLNNTAVALSTLEYCRDAQPAKVLWVSTDEVYGPMHHDLPHEEWSAIIPSNPYAASKAAQEAIAISYWRAYGVPLILTNTMNIIGERQDPVKYLPKAIRAVRAGKTLTVHGRTGDIGSRYYLHARNAADAWLWLLQHEQPQNFAYGAAQPTRYNVVGDERLSNLQLAMAVSVMMDRPLHYELVDFHGARPGHDPHYGLNGALLQLSGWKAPVDFAESLARTVRWTVDNPRWLES